MSHGGAGSVPSSDLDAMEPELDPTLARRVRGETVRAVAIGLGLALLISLGSYVALFDLRSTEPTRTFLPAALGTPFLLVILFNVIVARVRRRAALTRPSWPWCSPWGWWLRASPSSCSASR